jgi:hypothetical protein
VNVAIGIQNPSNVFHIFIQISRSIWYLRRAMQRECLI